MTEETQAQALSVSDMVRMTSENTADFMRQLADHVDGLTEQVATLTTRILELEGTQNDTESK